MPDNEYRKFPRISFREPVQYRPVLGQTPEGSLSCDLSAGGIRLRANDFIPLHTEMTLGFKLEERHPFELKSRVIWVERIPHAEAYQVGLEFTEEESIARVREELNRYVASRSSE